MKTSEGWKNYMIILKTPTLEDSTGVNKEEIHSFPKQCGTWDLERLKGFREPRTKLEPGIGRFRRCLMHLILQFTAFSTHFKRRKFFRSEIWTNLGPETISKNRRKYIKRRTKELPPCWSDTNKMSVVERNSSAALATIFLWTAEKGEPAELSTFEVRAKNCKLKDELPVRMVDK